jgi:hypothetical protein
MDFFYLRGRKKIMVHLEREDVGNPKYSHIGNPVLCISILFILRTLFGDGLGGGRTDWTGEEDVGRR